MHAASLSASARCEAAATEAARCIAVCKEEYQAVLRSRDELLDQCKAEKDSIRSCPFSVFTEDANDEVAGHSHCKPIPFCHKARYRKLASVQGSVRAEDFSISECLNIWRETVFFTSFLIESVLQSMRSVRN